MLFIRCIAGQVFCLKRSRFGLEIRQKDAAREQNADKCLKFAYFMVNLQSYICILTEIQK